VMDKAYDAAYQARHDAIGAVEKEIRAFQATMPSVGRLTLVKRFDRFAPRVLTQANIITEIHVERDWENEKRRPQAQYVALAPWPTVEAYTKLRNTHYTMTAEDAAEQARSTFEELGDELRSWYDNMPEGLQGGDKGSTVESAAEGCEEAASADLTVTDLISRLPVLHLPGETSSRGDRCADACSLLDDLSGACSDALDLLEKEGAVIPEWLAEKIDELIPETINEEDEAAVGNYTDEQVKEAIENLDTLRDECEDIKSNAEGIEFPGMY